MASRCFSPPLSVSLQFCSWSQPFPLLQGNTQLLDQTVPCPPSRHCLGNIFAGPSITRDTHLAAQQAEARPARIRAMKQVASQGEITHPRINT